MTTVLFMGTPDFAVPTLKILIKNYTIVGVVTQPDRPKGRGRKMLAPPVKETALAAGVPVFQPPTLRDATVVAELAALNPDVIVVAAFGQILRADVLAMPPHGCLNIHASLLPRWRGAAPVAAAIRAGDAETGVTLMKMDAGLDTGDIIRARAIPIRADHTRASLTSALAELGATLLAETLPDWLAGKIIPQKQDDALATFAPRIKKTEGLVDWAQPAVEIERQVRAFNPWPGAFTHWGEMRIKILAASVFDGTSVAPGRVLRHGDDVAVETGQGILVLHQLQPAGKRAMPATAFANGAPDLIGAQLH